MDSDRSGEGGSDRSVSETHREAALAQTVSPFGTVDPPGEDELALEARRARVMANLLGGQRQAPTIGRYAILKVLGEGGMGTVYAVFDDKLDRRVALKLVKGPRNEEARKRMLREAQAMAKLSHPNVVPVFEVGEHEGKLFLAMEYVDGMNLARWREEADPDWKAVLDKYVQAGRGLAAAHAEGLVHRDFKPHNAVLGDDGRVRVLDFGLATRGETEITMDLNSAVSPPPKERALDTRLTETGTVMGTPAYMPPEQFLAGGVDHRGDQFSFCVALWEALYGTRPFSGSDGKSLLGNISQEKFDEPPKDRGVPAAFRAILARGLKADPTERWPDLDALLEELEQPIRRARRAPFVWLGAAALLVGPFLGTQAVSSYRDAQQQARDRAVQVRETEAKLEATEEEAERTELKLQIKLLGESARLELEADRPMRALAYLMRVRELDPDNPTARGLLRKATAGASTFLEARRPLPGDRAIHVAWASNDRFVAVGADPRGEVEQILLFEVAPDGALRPAATIAPSLDDILGFAVSPSDGAVATLGRGGSIELYDPSTGTLRATLETVDVEAARPLVSNALEEEPWVANLPLQFPINAAFSPTGDQLYAVGIDGTVKTWDPETGELIASLPSSRQPLADVTVLDDLVLTESVFELEIRDRSGRILGRIDDMLDPVVSPDERYIATVPGFLVEPGNRPTRIHRPDGTLVTTLYSASGGATEVLFSPDGQTLALAYDGGQAIELRSVEDWRVRRRLTGMTEMPLELAFSPDGEKLVAMGTHRSVVWEVATGRALQDLATPLSSAPAADLDGAEPHTMTSLRFSRDGSRLMGASTAELLSWRATPAGQIAGARDSVASVAVTQDDRVFTLDGDGGLVERDPQLEPLHRHTLGPRKHLTINARGNTAVAYDDDGLVARRIDEERDVLRLSDPVKFVMLSPSGRFLFAQSETTVAGYDLQSTGSDSLFVDVVDREVFGHEVLVAPDESTVFHSADVTGVADVRAAMVLRELPTGKELDRRPLAAVYSAVAASHRGSFLVAAQLSGRHEIWTPGSKAEPEVLPGSVGDGFLLAVSPDDQWISSVSFDVLQIWDRAQRVRHASVQVAPHGLEVMAFAPSGSVLAGLRGDGTVSVFSVPDGAQLMEFTPTGEVTDVYFGASDDLLYAQGSRGLTVWDLGSELDDDELRSIYDRFCEWRLTPDGDLVAK